MTENHSENDSHPMPAGVAGEPHAVDGSERAVAATSRRDVGATKRTPDGGPFMPQSANPFVLDRTENPHPKMLVGARDARRRAAMGTPVDVAFWSGYLAAMCDATGETADAIKAWVERR